MKIVCIADLQGLFWDVHPDLLPEGDMLLIAGDLGSWGSEDELREFNDWLTLMPYKHKVFIAGNHDRCLAQVDGHNFLTAGTYLVNETVVIDGIKIYGTPASEMGELRFYSSFNAFCEPSFLQDAVDNMPDDADIVLAHGPCYGILDKLHDGRSVGSKELREAVTQKKPKYYVCGHIHESHGQETVFNTVHINAALCSEENQMLKNGKTYYEPVVIEL